MLNFSLRSWMGRKKASGKHGELSQDAQTEGAGKHTITAGPVDEGDGSDAQDFNARVEKRIGENGGAPGDHVLLIALGEFGASFLLAIEELDDAHAGDVFLEEKN